MNMDDFEWQKDIEFDTIFEIFYWKWNEKNNTYGLDSTLKCCDLKVFGIFSGTHTCAQTHTHSHTFIKAQLITASGVNV